MEENNRSNPAQLANEKMQEIENARVTKQLNDSMTKLSKDANDKASKEDLFKAMNELTKQVKLNEAKQIDAMTSATIQTALDISMQMKSLDDPRLRRQAMVTLKTINDSIKMSDDSSNQNVDDKAVKRNVKVAIDDLKTESLLSRLADKMSSNTGHIETTMDEAGPLFGLMKDAVKVVASKIKSKNKETPEVTFLDHQIVRDVEPEVKTSQVETSNQKELPAPVVNVSSPQPINNLPAPVVQPLPVINRDFQQPTVDVEYKALSENIVAVKEADESILDHIKEISTMMKEQLIFQKEDRERENIKNTEHNFRKFKNKPTQTTLAQPVVETKKEDGGGILDLVTSLLFGGKGILKTLTKFIGRAGVVILSMLNPKNIIKFAKGTVTAIIDVTKSVFGKVGGFLDDIGGVIGKFGQIGKLGKLAKGIPFIGQIIAVVVGIFDFFDSFSNASEVLGKAEEAVTLWDRVSAGVGGFIGGIVGIIDAVTSLLGFETDFGGTVKKFVAEYLADIPNIISKRIQMFVDLKDDIVAGVESAYNKVMAGVEVITGFLDDVSNFISNLGPALKKMFTEKARDILNMLPGGLGDKLLPTTEKPKVVEEKPKQENEKPKQEEDKPNIIQRAWNALPSLSDIFGDKEEKEKVEKEQLKAQVSNQSNSNTNNISNVSNTSNNIYQSQPISTRPADDSFRIFT